MVQVLGDKSGRRVKVLARIDGKERKVLKLKMVKIDPRGRIQAGTELANKYVVVMLLEPIEDMDKNLLSQVKALGGKDDGDENADEE